MAVLAPLPAVVMLSLPVRPLPPFLPPLTGHRFALRTLRWLCHRFHRTFFWSRSMHQATRKGILLASPAVEVYRKAEHHTAIDSKHASLKKSRARKLSWHLGATEAMLLFSPFLPPDEFYCRLTNAQIGNMLRFFHHGTAVRFSSCSDTTHKVSWRCRASFCQPDRQRSQLSCGCERLPQN
jgi:hypothetical protein